MFQRNQNWALKVAAVSWLKVLQNQIWFNSIIFFAVEFIRLTMVLSLSTYQSWKACAAIKNWFIYIFDVKKIFWLLHLSKILQTRFEVKKSLTSFKQQPHWTDKHFIYWLGICITLTVVVNLLSNCPLQTVVTTTFSSMSWHCCFFKSLCHKSVTFSKSGRCT